jgi:hypothetical protein
MVVQPMSEAHRAVREAGLLNVKLGNCGRFARMPEEFETLLAVGSEAIGRCMRAILAWEHNH